MPAARPDIWSEWLLARRQGGDPAARERVLHQLAPVRDRVLDGLGDLAAGTLLDVGCGDGLIAFGALERWPACQVVFSDVSQYLLDYCRDVAAAAGELARCQFVRSDAATLERIEDASVDAVTTRSVLIYVKDKQGAFESFRRVSRPDGRLSLFEPVNAMADRMGLDLGYSGFDVSPVADLAARVTEVYRQIQPDDDPMVDFDERDLVAIAIGAGFRTVDLWLNVHYQDRQWSSYTTRWDQWLDSAPNPKVPTFREAVQTALTPEEGERYLSYLRPLVEAGAGRVLMAGAYLQARAGEEASDGG